MNAKLIVEGKEFDIEILDTELEKLVKQNKKTGYEKAEKGRIGFMLNKFGKVDFCPSNCQTEKECYEVANYYSDKTVAENNARADKLMRQLRRFAVEHREEELDWSGICDKYYLYFGHEDGEICIDSHISAQDFGTIYFDMEYTAQLAIDTFRDELIWYFTEYKDSL
jgi:hypothetical protein